MAKLPRFWMSWLVPGSDGKPVATPAPSGVLAYWINAQTMDEAVVHGLIEATDAETAWSIVGSDGGWPEAKQHPHQRFIAERDPDWLPEARFPLPAGNCRLALMPDNSRMQWGGPGIDLVGCQTVQREASVEARDRLMEHVRSLLHEGLDKLVFEQTNDEAFGQVSVAVQAALLAVLPKPDMGIKFDVDTERQTVIAHIPIENFVGLTAGRVRAMGGQVDDGVPDPAVLKSKEGVVSWEWVTFAVPINKQGQIQQPHFEVERVQGLADGTVEATITTTTVPVKGRSELDDLSIATRNALEQEEQGREQGEQGQPGDAPGAEE